MPRASSICCLESDLDTARNVQSESKRFLSSFFFLLYFIEEWNRVTCVLRENLATHKLNFSRHLRCKEVQSVRKSLCAVGIWLKMTSIGRYQPPGNDNVLSFFLNSLATPSYSVNWNGGTTCKTGLAGSCKADLFFASGDNPLGRDLPYRCFTRSTLHLAFVIERVACALRKPCATDNGKIKFDKISCKLFRTRISPRISSRVTHFLFFSFFLYIRYLTVLATKFIHIVYLLVFNDIASPDSVEISSSCFSLSLTSLFISLLLSLFTKGTITPYARYKFARKPPPSPCLVNICLYRIDSSKFPKLSRNTSAFCVTFYSHLTNLRFN